MGKSKNILLYTVSWCPHCAAIKRFLDSKGEKYREFDVEADDARWKEALARTGGQDIVPVIDVDGKVLFGAFNRSFEENLTKLLER